MPEDPTPQSTPVAEPLLPEAWEVPPEFRDRLGEEAGRQRVMEADGTVNRDRSSFRSNLINWTCPCPLFRR